MFLLLLLLLMLHAADVDDLLVDDSAVNVADVVASIDVVVVALVRDDVDINVAAVDVAGVVIDDVES